MTYIQLLEATSETLFSNRGISRLWNKIKTQMCSSVAEGQGQLAAQSTKQGILSRKTELKHFLSWFMSDSIKQYSSYSRKCPRFLELQKLFPPKRRTRILLEIKESWKSSNMHDDALTLWLWFPLSSNRLRTAQILLQKHISIKKNNEINNSSLKHMLQNKILEISMYYLQDTVKLRALKMHRIKILLLDISQKEDM